MSAITQPDPCAACGAVPGGGGKKKSHPCKYVPKGTVLNEGGGLPVRATEPLLIFRCATCGYAWPTQTNLNPGQTKPL